MTGDREAQTHLVMITSGPLAFSLHSILLARVLLDAPLRADMVGDNGGRGMAAERDTTDAAGFCEAPLSAILALETVGARSLPFRVGVTVALAVTGASEAAELVRERDRGQGMVTGLSAEWVCKNAAMEQSRPLLQSRDASSRGGRVSAEGWQQP